MLTGKKFHLNVRALSFAMLELLGDYVGEMKIIYQKVCSQNTRLIT